jgi:ribonuclease Z
LSRKHATPVSALRLVNGSAGDPAVYLDFPGPHNAVLFDAGELDNLSRAELGDVGVLLLSHHHLDHLVGFARLLRFNLDREKTLQVYGPPQTIDRIEHKLRSHAYQRFEFMRLVLEVTELVSGAPWRRARFECQQGFQREELPSGGSDEAEPTLFHEQRECRLRFVTASHTVPCLSYCLEVKRGLRFDRVKARDSVLRPGRWVGRVIEQMAKPRKRRDELIQVGSGRFELTALVDEYFTTEPPSRIAFVTDCRAEPEIWPQLVALSRGAQRLYCDCYYLDQHRAKARQHGHMTAKQAAQLAIDAGVESLWLMHFGPRYQRDFQVLLAEARELFPDAHAALPDARRED